MQKYVQGDRRRVQEETRRAPEDSEDCQSILLFLDYSHPKSQGAKIRSSYIAFAHKESKRLATLVETTAREIVTQEKEVARLKGHFTFLLSDHCLTVPT